MKNSINNAQVIGTLKEMNLELVTKEVTLGNGTSKEKKVTCQQFAKKEFKNPMFTVEVNGSDIGVDFFAVSEKKLDDNGNVVDNPRFKSFVTIFENYVPKMVDAENATRVKIDGSLRENGYVDKNTFDWKSFMVINGFSMTSSNVPEEDSSDSEISGVITNIMHEIKADETETGRLLVELYSFDNNGDGFPIKLVVESDMARDFESYYEIGQSVKLYYEVAIKQVGGAKPTVGGFGRRDSKRVSGFTVTEYSVFRGEDPFEEENDYYVTVDEVLAVKNAREIMIKKKQDEAKNAPKGGSNVKPSPKATASATSKANPFGNSASTSDAPKKKNPFA